MDASKWLGRLAAALGAELGTARAREYLEELDEWQLTADEWESLRCEAKRRFRFFPTLAELHDLMLEVVKRQDEPGAAPAWELVTVDGHEYAKRPTRR